MGVISLQLSVDEALVLFDWLGRFNARTQAGDFVDQAEQRSLWNLECVLESQLVEPLHADYLGILDAARNRLRDHDSEGPVSRTTLSS